MSGVLVKTLINGINIDYREEGEGTPLILIHAFPMNQAMWADQIQALSPVCHVISLDLRGFGNSDVPTGPYWMALMASDIRGLMSRMGIERAVLVGLSMGGYVAMSFYHNFPDAVRGLVLADTRAAADSSEGRERRFKSAEKAEREGTESIVDEMVQLLLSQTAIEKRPDIVERVRAIALQNRAEGLAGAQRGMAARVDSTVMLSSADCPALVIVGSDDRLSTPEETAGWQRRMPNSRLVKVEGAGHLSNIEQPESFNRAVGDFVSTLSS
jgi:pimeloyl-ACP methyl ester carboxylesterase